MLSSRVGLGGLGGLVGGNLLEVPKGLSKSASSCGPIILSFLAIIIITDLIFQVRVNSLEIKQLLHEQ